MRALLLFFLLLGTSPALFAGEGEKPQTCDVSVRGKDVEVVKGASPDLEPYVSKFISKVRDSWFKLIPKSVREAPYKRGCTLIELTVSSDGRIADMRLKEPSGDVDMDRAAWGGVTWSNPFEPFPRTVKEKEITLRIRFLYNPDKNNTEKERKQPSPQSGDSK